MAIMMIDRWLHIVAGVMWIGLLYYFNFVQVPAMAAANADKDGPGPAAIGKYVAPRALFWFRWAALVTWLTGAIFLATAPQYSLHGAFSLGIGAHNPSLTAIGFGAWLGTIMLFNVWMLDLAEPEEDPGHRAGQRCREGHRASRGLPRVPHQHHAVDSDADVHAGRCARHPVLRRVVM
jgi:hypothetical protein